MEVSPDPISHRITRQHLDILVQYMERYPRLALATARNREALMQSKHMWEKIARVLNKLDENVSKTGRGWSKYWVCRKFKARRKYSILRKCQRDEVQCAIKLDIYDEKIIKMITDKDGNLLPVNAVTDENINIQVEAKGSPMLDTKIFAGKSEEGLNNDTEENTMVTPELVDVDIKPFVQDDPIRIVDMKSLTQVKKKQKTIPENKRRNTDDNKRSIEELRRKMIEFELRRQKELFEIERKQMRERHKMEMELLELKKQLLIKELNNQS